MHVAHCFYFLMFVYMDHVSELKLMYACMHVNCLSLAFAAGLDA